MTETTTSNPSGERVDPVDQITQLLQGGSEQTNDEPRRPEVETPTQGNIEASTGEGEGEESGEEGEGEGSQGYSEEDAAILAEALGIPAKDVLIGEDGQFRIAVKVDGEISHATMEELKTGLSAGRNYTQKSQALAEERRHFEQTRAAVSHELQERLQLHDRLTAIQHDALLNDFKRVDWDKLRAENPGEYAALIKDYEARKGQLDSLRSALQVERQQLEAEANQEFQQKRQQYLASQYERTLENNPAWADPKKLEADMNAMSDFVAKTYGVTPEEFAYLDDARHIEILKDAMAYRNGKAFADKKLEQAPNRFVKGGRSGKPMSKLTQLTLNANKATGATKRRLQADAVHELLTSGG